MKARIVGLGLAALLAVSGAGALGQQAGTPRTGEAPIDLGGVTERHEMVPMRDGTRLSVYLYLPPGRGPWPVLLEQRYSDMGVIMHSGD
jgi:predicted acyl esterase